MIQKLIIFIFFVVFTACKSHEGNAPGPVVWDPCVAHPLNLTSGTKTINEQYNQGVGTATFGELTAPCWKTHNSSFILQDSDFSAGFSSQTINSTSQNARSLSLTYRAGIETNATVNYIPYATPDTGWDSGQWPYIFDLIQDTQCYADVEVTAQLKPSTSPGGAEVYGVLLNARVNGAGSSKTISGYLIHANGGGASVTLVKLDNAFDHAFDYLDHFPGYNLPPLQPNPLTDGPYKGWDFKNTPWAAGGSTNGSQEVTIAARYRYDFAALTATIDWEVRPSGGADSTPGVYDRTRILTGADALSPLGGYGVYTTMYGALASGHTNTTSIGEFRMVCRNP